MKTGARDVTYIGMDARDAQMPLPGDHVTLTGPSGAVYRGILGITGEDGIELYREGRTKPCVFPAGSKVEPDIDT